ncbi:helix-turn-helix domain-containing protein [Streptomyces harbinensis]|uniref:Helix-turn-helix domain-containing protein n=2 Tax=Streptomyces harbinensis TaxID=1176198 RepID=A0A1I6PPI0_9ACTN|nr:Helix-turn-helix domain-containing protein [Streptomyces harbinensis]
MAVPRSNQRKKNNTAMRTVGALVGRLRTQAGLSQGALADKACVAMETIASIEQGRRPLLPHMAERLDSILESKGVLWVLIDNLPDETKFPIWVLEYVAHEQEAIALSWYENQVLPGLLQTEGYARAVLENIVPILSKEETESRLVARLERQAVLHREGAPLNASFIVWEPVLRYRIGGDGVYFAQLRHLRACAELPGISLQVMPLSGECNAGLDGPFILLETPEHQQLAYTEVQRGSHLIHDPYEVSILSQKYAMLRSQALSPKESMRLVDQLLGES